MKRASTEAIVIHCTATLAHHPFDVKAIRAMHIARGFSDIGYAFLIGLNGETWEGRKPVDAVGAHVEGFNSRTIGISYVGGLASATAKPTDTRTDAQKRALEALLRKLVLMYPSAVILGHRDLSPDRNGDGAVTSNEWMKSCPCFEAGPWAKSLGLPGGKYSRGKFVRL
jgi:N-acetylmuramoyl-L-alanine amidase